MSDPAISFVTTTINEPTFLEGYLENAQAHGHTGNELEFVVIGDLKTPGAVREYCASLASEYETPVRYESVDDQSAWLGGQGLDALQEYLPHNSIQRRNVGYLQAAHRGADVIVSLDDDNLARDHDIVGAFGQVGEACEVLEVESPNGWYNCASMLEYEAEHSRDVYHRGFPYSRRNETIDYDFEPTTRRIMIRAGLWLDVPDIDVITHLERAPRARALRDEFTGELVALGEGTYCPVNTQNTAFHSDLMPLIHTIPMGDRVEGMELSRFDDIWLGFFAKKILDEIGGTVAYGRPLSTHDRNTHHLKRELEHEAIGIRLNEVVVDTLETIDIDGETPAECYRSLIDEFRTAIQSEVEYSFVAYFEKMLDGMEIWADACDSVLTS
jgi:hypothetical protein